MPYPVVATSVEGIGDGALRTKVNGSTVATVGSVLKTCHGNEPGTLKEVLSLTPDLGRALDLLQQRL